MPMLRCAKGHPYSDKLPSCPTCESELSLLEIASARPNPPRDIDSRAPTPPPRARADASPPSDKSQVDSVQDLHPREETMDTPASYGTPPIPEPTAAGGVHALPRRRAMQALGLLLSLDGREPGRFYALFAGPNSIGRSSDPDTLVSLQGDDHVSTRHAEIECQPEGGPAFLLRDLGSTHGTYLNDDRLRLLPDQTVALQPGDVVRFGRTRLRFEPLQA